MRHIQRFPTLVIPGAYPYVYDTDFVGSPAEPDHKFEGTLWIE